MPSRRLWSHARDALGSYAPTPSASHESGELEPEGDERPALPERPPQMHSHDSLAVSRSQDRPNPAEPYIGTPVFALNVLGPITAAASRRWAHRPQWAGSLHRRGWAKSTCRNATAPNMTTTNLRCVADRGDPLVGQPAARSTHHLTVEFRTPDCRGRRRRSKRHGVSMSRTPNEMCVSVLEAGFLWRVRVLQGRATRHGGITSVRPWCR